MLSAPNRPSCFRRIPLLPRRVQPMNHLLSVTSSQFPLPEWPCISSHALAPRSLLHSRGQWDAHGLSSVRHRMSSVGDSNLQQCVTCCGLVYSVVLSSICPLFSLLMFSLNSPFPFSPRCSAASCVACRPQRGQLDRSKSRIPDLQVLQVLRALHALQAVQVLHQTR